MFGFPNPWWKRSPKCSSGPANPFRLTRSSIRDSRPATISSRWASVEHSVLDRLVELGLGVCEHRGLQPVDGLAMRLCDVREGLT